VKSRTGGKGGKRNGGENDVGKYEIEVKRPRGKKLMGLVDEFEKYL